MTSYKALQHVAKEMMKNNPRLYIPLNVKATDLRNFIDTYSEVNEQPNIMNETQSGIQYKKDNYNSYFKKIKKYHPEKTKKNILKIMLLSLLMTRI